MRDAKDELFWKLRNAASDLASGEGEIKTRLESAGLTIITKMRDPEELPPELRDEYEAVHRDLTSKESVGDKGKLNATIAGLSSFEASRLAERIFDLFVHLLRAPES